LTKDRFPFQFRDKTIEINAMTLFLKLKEGVEYDDTQPLVFDLKKEGGAEFSDIEFKIAESPIDDLPHAKPFERRSESPGEWSLEVEGSSVANPALRRTVNIDGVDHFRLNSDAIEDIVIICHYTAAMPSS
jgi:hypothetical protein